MACLCRAGRLQHVPILARSGPPATGALSEGGRQREKNQSTNFVSALFRVSSDASTEEAAENRTFIFVSRCEHRTLDEHGLVLRSARSAVAQAAIWTPKIARSGLVEGGRRRASLLLRLEPGAGMDQQPFRAPHTDRTPSKSVRHRPCLPRLRGCAATDPLEDLLTLRIVSASSNRPYRAGLPDRAQRDGSESMPLSYRFYLSDAAFLVAVQGDLGVAGGPAGRVAAAGLPVVPGSAILSAVGRLDHGCTRGDISEALADHPWLASSWVQKACRSADVCARHCGGLPGKVSRAVISCGRSDHFDPAIAIMGGGTVRHGRVTVANLPTSRSPAGSW